MADRGDGEALDTEAAVDLLRQRLPEFGPAIAEHREDNFGELLFHLLMGDLARFDMITDEFLRAGGHDDHGHPRARS